MNSKAHPSKLSDEVLMQHAPSDLSAFETLIERYEAKLLRYVLRISQVSTEEAEEVLQEAFLKAWVNIHSFDPSLKFSSWIYRIVHNETISLHRKHKSRGLDKKISIEENLFEIHDEAKDLETALDTKLQADAVRDCLNRLPKNYRDVLVLRYLEDQSYEEISDIIKKPIGTVGTLVNRAKKAFQANYNPQSHG